MNAKISMFVICVEAIIYLLLYNLHDCTFNETMINNKDSGHNNTLWNAFIGLFSVVILIGVICFFVFIYFKCIKDKKLYKNKKYINY